MSISANQQASDAAYGPIQILCSLIPPPREKKHIIPREKGGDVQKQRDAGKKRKKEPVDIQ